MRTVHCGTCGVEFDPEREGAARLLYDRDRGQPVDSDLCPTCSVRHLAVSVGRTERDRKPRA